MIDFNYTAPELLPFRIQEVLDAPNEPHRIGGVVYVPEGGGECEQVLTDCNDGLMPPFTAHCSACGAEWGFTPKHCPECGARVTGTRDERKAVKR